MKRLLISLLLVCAPALANPYTDKYDFIAGEVTSIDLATGTIVVDITGESKARQLTIYTNDRTVITRGEDDRLKLGRYLISQSGVDIEYEKDTHVATYIFVY